MIEKLYDCSVPLLGLPARISRGSSTGMDDVFMVRRTRKGYETREGVRIELDEAVLRIPLYATDYGRYSFRPVGEERIVFPYEVSADRYSLMDESRLRSDFPNTFEYLKNHKRQLQRRKQFATWYSFSAPRNLDTHDEADLLVPLLADKGLLCQFPKTQRRKYCLMASGGFSISIDPASGYSSEYVLGILNSKVMFWMLRRISNLQRRMGDVYQTIYGKAADKADQAFGSHCWGAAGCD